MVSPPTSNRITSRCHGRWNRKSTIILACGHLLFTFLDPFFSKPYPHLRGGGRRSGQTICGGSVLSWCGCALTFHTLPSNPVRPFFIRSRRKYQWGGSGLSRFIWDQPRAVRPGQRNNGHKAHSGFGFPKLNPWRVGKPVVAQTVSSLIPFEQIHSQSRNSFFWFQNGKAMLQCGPLDRFHSRRKPFTDVALPSPDLSNAVRTHNRRGQLNPREPGQWGRAWELAYAPERGLREV